MNHDPASQDRITEADEREWLAQERALRDERLRAPSSDDPNLHTYRQVVRALRAPLPDGLPADFAERVAAQRRHAMARVDTRLELQAEQVLLVALFVAALVACSIYGGDWLRASLAALPLLDRATTLNWAAALAACLGLSWAMSAIDRPGPMR